MMTCERETFDHLYLNVVKNVNTHPQFMCAPRGSKIKEELVVTLQLNDPRHRLIKSFARDPSYAFGVGEFLWYWQGKNDLKTMLYYNRRMASFSDDGEHLNSAYGLRLMGKKYWIHGDDPVSQWETCKKTLIDDPDSRRAVMLINDQVDQRAATYVGSKDVPCTLSLQFFIRYGMLYLHANMRSNDVIWGLPYDLFSFTLLQECMMLELRESMSSLELGSYFHTAGSMHVYERHFLMADRIVDEYVSRSLEEQHGPMEPISSLGDLWRLCAHEELLREHAIESIPVDEYVGSLKWMAQILNAHRERRDAKQGAQDA